MSEHEVAVDRKKRMGGHAAGAVCDLHPHLKPISVYRAMTEEVPDEPTDAMIWGTMVEPALLRWAEEKLLGAGVRPAKPSESERYSWLRSSPDAVFGGSSTAVRGLVSAKHVGAYRARFWGSSKSDRVPDYANIQEQLYMGLEGFDVSYVVASVGGKPPELWAVPFSQAVFDALLEATDGFMRRHVLPRVPPAPDGSKAYGRWISDTVKQRQPELMAVAPGSTLEAVVEAYRIERINSELAEMRLARADQCLRVAIGEAAGLVTPKEEKITYRADKRGVRTLRVPKTFRSAAAEEDEG